MNSGIVLPLQLARRAHHASQFRVQRLPVQLQALKEKGRAHYSLLSTAPPIVYAVHGRDMSSLAAAIGHRPAYFLYALWWTHEDEAAVESLKRQQAQHQSVYPEHHFFYLCNSQREVDLLRRSGLNAVWCNHNCLVDESIFAPQPLVQKRYDAVYDAQISPFKQHPLAQRIDSLALISYMYRPGVNRDYAAEVRRLLAHAHWFNDPYRRDYRKLSAEEVAHSVRQCRVGLCLSNVEGAMYASIQYLLCGLPVVSVRSRGGRDVFFDEEYVKVVEASPEAVRDGVREMIRRAVPAEVIRNKTLAKVQEHRDRFIALMQSIYDGEGVRADFRAQWPQVFFNKMVRFEKLSVAAGQIRRAASGPRAGG